MNPSDEALIAQACRDDDPAAFATLVRRHQSAVRAFLRQLTQDHAWADDLAQDTFILAHRSLAKFNGQSRFSTWLLGLAFNLFRNARRRQRPERFTVLTDTTPDSAPDATETTERTLDLRAALQHLSEAEQHAIHACYVQDLTHEEAAALLRLPLGTLKTHLHRAKQKLKTLLRPWALSP